MPMGLGGKLQVPANSAAVEWRRTVTPNLGVLSINTHRAVISQPFLMPTMTCYSFAASL